MLRGGKLFGGDSDHIDKATPQRAQVLLEEAAEAMGMEDYSTARELFATCLKIYRQLAMKHEVAQMLFNLAECISFKGEVKEAREFFEESIEAHRNCKDKPGLTTTLLAFGAFLLDRSGLPLARKSLLEAIELSTLESYREQQALGLYLIAAVEAQDGDLNLSADYVKRAEHACTFIRESLPLADAAARLAKASASHGVVQAASGHIEQSIRLYRGSGYLAAVVPSLLKVMHRVRVYGRPELVAHFAESLIGLYASSKRSRGESGALRIIGSIALRLGDTSTAYALFKVSLERARGINAWRDRSGSYLAMGCVAFREGHEELARSLFDRSFTESKEALKGVELIEQMIKISRRVLYIEDFDAAALYFARCAAQARYLGEIEHYIRAMFFRGCVANLQGDHTAASRHLEECLIYYADVNHRKRLGRTLTEKGVALSGLGESTKGREAHMKALDIARTIQDDTGVYLALNAIGSWPTNESNLQAEIEALQECIKKAPTSHAEFERYAQLAVEVNLAVNLAVVGRQADACGFHLKFLMQMPLEGRLLGCARALEGCAILAGTQALDVCAAELLGKARSLRKRIGSEPAGLRAGELQELAYTLERRIGNSELTALLESGAAFDPVQVVIGAWSVVESFKWNEANT